MDVRPATAADAPVLADLAGELGYPTTVAEMEARLVSALGRPGRTILVAVAAGTVVGWIDVAERHPLQQAPFAEIEGLVVADRHRSSGIGASLVDRAERWARERGLGSVGVRSRSTRTGAHGFYRSLGYEDVKTSLVFRKTL